MALLASLGQALSYHVYDNKYKVNTNSVIEENLYKLIEDIKEITFKKVDAIALKHDYERCDKRRVKAAIIYTMEELCNTLGHCYLNIEEIYKYTIMFLGNNISEEDFIEILNELILLIKYLNTLASSKVIPI